MAEEKEEKSLHAMTLEQRDSKWWDDWWESEEFAWDNLPKMPLIGWSVVNDALVRTKTPRDEGGAREATLQDYYRWDDETNTLRSDEALAKAGLLFEKTEDLPAFHIFQYPSNKRDKSGTWKRDLDHTNWSILEAELQRKFEQSNVTKVDAQGIAIDCDNRCLMDGGIYRAMPSISRASSDRRSREERHYIGAFAARFLNPVIVHGMHFGCAVDLQNAVFEQGATFYEVECDSEFLFWNAISAKDLRLHRSKFRKSANFRHSFFAESLSITRCEFLDSVSLNESKIGASITIHQSDLGDDLELYEVNISDGMMVQETELKANLNLGKAEVSKRLAIVQSTLTGNLYKHEIKLNCDLRFSGSTFKRPLSFSGFEIGHDIFFDRVTFEGMANFTGTKFQRNAYFSEAEFKSKTSFRSAKFNRDAIFSSATFTEWANFTGARFVQNAPNDKTESTTDNLVICRFAGTRFQGDVWFRDVEFDRPATFAGSEFRSSVYFGARIGSESQASILGARFHHLTSFRSSQFYGASDFFECVFPTRASDRAGAFQGVRFRGAVDFRGIRQLPFSMFDNAQIEKGILLNPHDPSDRQFKQAIRDVRATLRDDHNAPTRPTLLRRLRNLIPWWKPNTPDHDPDRANRGRNQRFGSLESGCRALKRAMAESGDFQREQQFYRYELIARRKRPANKLFVHGNSSISISEKLFSWLYSSTADYGTAVARPLIIVAAMTFGFGIAFWLWSRLGAGLPIDAGTLYSAFANGDFSQASEFSLQNAFRPFGVWWPNFPGGDASWANVFKQDIGSAGWNWVRILASIQSFFTIVMLFLSALALRRKFQIG